MTAPHALGYFRVLIVVIISVFLYIGPIIFAFSLNTKSLATFAIFNTLTTAIPDQCLQVPLWLSKSEFVENCHARVFTEQLSYQSEDPEYPRYRKRPPDIEIATRTFLEEVWEREHITTTPSEKFVVLKDDSH